MSSCQCLTLGICKLYILCFHFSHLTTRRTTCIQRAFFQKAKTQRIKKYVPPFRYTTSFTSSSIQLRFSVVSPSNSYFLNICYKSRTLLNLKAELTTMLSVTPMSRILIIASKKERSLKQTTLPVTIHQQCKCR